MYIFSSVANNGQLLIIQKNIFSFFENAVTLFYNKKLEKSLVSLLKKKFPQDSFINKKIMTI